MSEEIKPRWYLSSEVFDALTPEMRAFINDPAQSSIWGSRLLIDVIPYPHLCEQLVTVAKIVERHIATRPTSQTTD